MFDRKEVKQTGKANFKKHYWLSVLAAIIAVVFAVGSTGFNLTLQVRNRPWQHSINSTGSQITVTNPEDINGLNIASPNAANEEDNTAGASADNTAGNSALSAGLAAVIIAVVLVSVLIGLILGFAVTAFLQNPLLLGANKWFLQNGREDNASPDYLVDGFKAPYMNKVRVMFSYIIRVFLWSLLFIIPGIVKAFEYRLVPYIVCDNPEISTKEALQKSRDMMRGNKWKAFVLDLSFLGWDLLSVLTLGILEVLYVMPYKQATNAALYETLNAQCNAPTIPETLAEPEA